MKPGIVRGLCRLRSGIFKVPEAGRKRVREERGSQWGRSCGGQSSELCGEENPVFGDFWALGV